MQQTSGKKASPKTRVRKSTKKVARKASMAKSAHAVPGNRKRMDRGVVTQIKSLVSHYNLTALVAAEILDVSPKTYSRYLENSKPLSAQQKDRINIVGSILGLGKRVLGSDAEVRNWLYRPVHSIENQRPIDLMVSESGRRRVENVLLQIEGGVY